MTYTAIVDHGEECASFFSGQCHRKQLIGGNRHPVQQEELRRGL